MQCPPKCTAVLGVLGLGVLLRLAAGLSSYSGAQLPQCALQHADWSRLSVKTQTVINRSCCVYSNACQHSQHR